MSSGLNSYLRSLRFVFKSNTLIAYGQTFSVVFPIPRVPANRSNANFIAVSGLIFFFYLCQAPTIYCTCQLWFDTQLWVRSRNHQQRYSGTESMEYFGQMDFCPCRCSWEWLGFLKVLNKRVFKQLNMGTCSLDIENDSYSIQFETLRTNSNAVMIHERIECLCYVLISTIE